MIRAVRPCGSWIKHYRGPGREVAVLVGTGSSSRSLKHSGAELELPGRMTAAPAADDSAPDRFGYSDESDRWMDRGGATPNAASAEIVTRTATARLRTVNKSQRKK